VPDIAHHMFFSVLSNICDRAMHKLCKLAITTAEQASSDLIFQKGQGASSMLFVSDGSLQYSVSHTSKQPQRTIGVLEWSTEACLWTMWVHVGELRAMSESRVLCIDSSEFGRAIVKFLASWQLARPYALAFVNMLNSVGADELSDLYDPSLDPTLILESAGSADSLLPNWRDTGRICRNSHAHQGKMTLQRLATTVGLR